MTRKSGLNTLMYESKNEPLLGRVQFYWRLLSHALIATLVVIGSLVIGVFGFVYFEQMLWHDALLHAVFLLGGLGALSMPASMSGKVFLAVYGLYASLVFVTALGIVFAPIAHRIAHSFHVDAQD